MEGTAKRIMRLVHMWRLDGGHRHWRIMSTCSHVEARWRTQGIDWGHNACIFSSKKKHHNKRKYSWGKVTAINMFERAILIYICVTSLRFRDNLMT